MQLYPDTATLPSNEVSSEWAEKYEKDASVFWDKFYKRSGNRFFKDRHYLHREFPQLSASNLTVLEVGCGVGNTVWPLLEASEDVFVYACDFSAVAVGILRSQPAYVCGRVHAFQADLVQGGLHLEVPEGGVDVCTMIFVLSAIAPENLAAAVRSVADVLRPGKGRVLFRDYAKGDLAEERLAADGRQQKLDGSFYVRGDGTRCLYFTQEQLRQLFAEQGFDCEDLHVHTRTVRNHARSLEMNRRWLQGVFRYDPRSLQGRSQRNERAAGCGVERYGTGEGRSREHRPRSGAGGAPTWLAGAAGRLASQQPLVGSDSPSSRSQLPGSLDDPEAEVLEILQQTRGGAAELQDAGCADAEGAGRWKLPQEVEAEVDSSFFEVVARDTSEVVQEEICAAQRRGMAAPGVSLDAALHLHLCPFHRPPSSEAAAAPRPPPPDPGDVACSCSGTAPAAVTVWDGLADALQRLSARQAAAEVQQLFQWQRVLQLGACSHPHASLVLVQCCRRLVLAEELPRDLDALARAVRRWARHLPSERVRIRQLRWQHLLSPPGAPPAAAAQLHGDIAVCRRAAGGVIDRVLLCCPSALPPAGLPPLLRRLSPLLLPPHSPSKDSSNPPALLLVGTAAQLEAGAVASTVEACGWAAQPVHPGVVPALLQHDCTADVPSAGVLLRPVPQEQ